MRKKWAKRRSEEAVSPVIATILMVAITVVLAAVLYVMVLQFQFDINNVFISADGGSTQTNWTFDIVSIQGTTQLSTADVYVIVKMADLDIGLMATSLKDLVSGTYHNGVRFMDASNQDNLNVGDFFTLDRDIYEQGSQVILTDYTQTHIFGTYEV